MKKYYLYFDGLCEPRNPGGVATYGFLIKDQEGNVICKGKGVIGAGMFGDDVTNNVAEYKALIEGLKCFKEKIGEGELVIRGDSQLVIRQMKGEYKVKARRIVPLYEEAKRLTEGIKVVFEWVPRKLNEEADKLSREAFKEFVERYKREYERYYKRGEGIERNPHS